MTKTLNERWDAVEPECEVDFCDTCDLCLVCEVNEPCIEDVFIDHWWLNSKGEARTM